MGAGILLLGYVAADALVSAALRRTADPAMLPLLGLPVLLLLGTLLCAVRVLGLIGPREGRKADTSVSAAGS